MPTTFFILPIVLLIFAFIFAKITTSLFEIQKYKFHFAIFFFLIFVGFIATLIGIRFVNNIFLNGIYFISAHFLGAIWLSFLIIVPIYIFKKIYTKIFWKNFSQTAKIFSLIIIVLFNIYGLYNGYVTTIRQVDIDSEKNFSLTGKKIILVADNHYGKIFNQFSAQKFIEKINAIEAEFALLAGDLFDWPEINFEAIAHEFSKSNKKIYFAAWNHEEYGDTERMLQAVNASGFISLINESTFHNNDTEIVWVTYSDTHSASDFEQILSHISPEENTFKILIKHSPTHLHIAENAGYDLTVSGHTHRGQMWPFSLITDYIYGSHSHGLTIWEKTHFYTTTGIGGWWPPQRLGSQSEIIVLNIK